MNNDVLNFQKDSGDPQLRLVPERADQPAPVVVDKQFVNFIFLKVNPSWRKLDPEAKRIFKADFANIYEQFAQDFLLFSYSLVGFDSKADLMFWRIGTSLDRIQEMTAKLFRTRLGSHLETAENYLSVTKKMMFVGHASEDRQQVQAGTTNYHFFYPCAKTPEWFEMPTEQRDALIQENFMVGQRFPNIKIHLTHAFGFTDTEYLISFETDEPRDFLALTEGLRQTAASKLTMRGMPVYTCRKRSLMECLDALG